MYRFPENLLIENPDKKAISTNVKFRTKKQITHVMRKEYLVRNPDKKAFVTRATVSLTAISGQNSYPPVQCLQTNAKI